MSDLTNSHLKKTGKKMVLGRGLGSLLGEPRLQLTKELNPSSPSSRAQGQQEVQAPSAPLASSLTTSHQQKMHLDGAETENGSFSSLNSIQPSIPPSARVWSISVDNIYPNMNQPRQIFSPDHLKELSDSIKEKGILQPIVARIMKDGGYEIIAGERRWRAAQQAGLHEVPVILKEIDDQEALEVALIENIQRADLNPIEEAEAYAHLINKYRLTQQQLAEKVGKERVTVANTMRLLNLAPEVRVMVSKGELSLGQAKVLLSVDNPKIQRQLAGKVKNDRLSVRATEKLVLKTFRSINQDESKEVSSSERAVQTLAEELQKIMGTKVNIDYLSGKGKLTISFYSDEDLNNLVDRLKNLWQK